MFPNFQVYYYKNRNSRPEVFCKKGVLRNFVKFTGKHLCQSLFFNKVAGLGHHELIATAPVSLFLTLHMHLPSGDKKIHFAYNFEKPLCLPKGYCEITLSDSGIFTGNAYS